MDKGLILHSLITGLTTNILIFFCMGAHAEYSTDSDGSQDPSSPVQQREQQRERFTEAIRLVRLGRKADYKQLKQQLEQYPLYAYLEYEEIIRNFPATDTDKITSFVEQYKNTPLANRLMQDWLRYLGRKGLWYRYSKSYEEAYSTTRLACYHGYSLYRLGQRQLAFEIADNLWAVDHSQVDECDSLFNAWKDAGRLNPEIAWQRFDKSLDGNNLKLASYLMRYLSNEGRTRAKLHKQVHTNPAIIARYARFNKDTAENRKLILKGLARLARSDASAAIKHFAIYNKTHGFTEAERDNIQLRLGIHLMWQSDNTDQLASLPEHITRNPNLKEAVIRNRLKQSDWPAVIAHILSLPENKQALPRWQYWKARALYLSADPAMRGQGFELFRELANFRNFYGFLAADRIGETYQFEHSPTPLDEVSLHALEQLPGIQRALELYALNKRTSARREWLYASRNFSSQEQIISAEIASRRGWHKRAIQSMIDAKAWDDLNTRFPLAFYDIFSANASKADIPIRFSLAIARQESAFMPDAKSGSGALGLMQLMPTTAKVTARKLGIRYRSSRELLDPEVNIKLGSAYLSTMLKRFNNNRILASAAYNAGPSRVKKWIDDSLAFDAWIETIPFMETRQYVQNVLMFAAIYGRHQGEDYPLVYPHEISDFGKIQLAQPGPVGMIMSSEETQKTPVF